MTAIYQYLKQFKHYSLIIVLTLFTGLALTYNLILPLGEVSDASAHFALIRFIAEEGRPPLTLAERSEVGIKGDASPVYHSLVALLTQHIPIDDFPELPRMNQADERTIPGDQRMHQIYFHTEDEAWPFQGIALVWHLAGLVSIPMGMATIVAVYFTVLTISPRRPHLALTAAAFVAFLPRFIISSAVINDDNLVFPLIAWSLYVLVKIIHGSDQRRMFIILGLLIGLAMVTKYHSLILLLDAALVLLILGWRRGWGWVVTLRRGLWLLAAFIITSGWWLGFILIRFNDIENSGLISGLAAPFGDPVVTEGSVHLFSSEFNTLSIWEFELWLSWTFRSFWLHYDGLDTGMQALGQQTTYWGIYVLYGCLLGIACLGLLIKAIRYAKTVFKTPQALLTWRLDYSLLAIHFLIYLGLVILRYMLFPAWSTSQGRHLYPAITSIAFFWALGWDTVWQQLVKIVGRRSGGPSISRDPSLAVVDVSGQSDSQSSETNGDSTPSQPPPSRERSKNLPPAGGDSSGADRVAIEASDSPPGPPKGGEKRPNSPLWGARGATSDTRTFFLSALEGGTSRVSPILSVPALISSGILLAISLIILPTFFWPVYYPLLPIKTIHPDDASIPHRLTEQFADELRFEGYDLPQTEIRPGQAIPVTLYWRTRLKQTQDYLMQTCLHDATGTLVTCHRSHPVNGRYPVRAWEEGYLIRDQLYVPTPTCLSPGTYQLNLSAIPLRLDTLAPTIDQATASTTSVSLGAIQISGSPVSSLPTKFWVDNTRYTNNIPNISQLNQTITLLQMDTTSTVPLIHQTTAQPWQPLDIETAYTCADGTVASTHTYVAHPGVEPGRYQLDVASPQTPLPVNVLTRPRNFELPAEIGTPLGAVFDDKIELLGYDLDPKPRLPGDSIEITTYWRSLKTMSHSYIGSFHLLDNTLTMWTQSDSPLGSDYPTVLWSPGEVITSTYKLPVTEFVPAGQYTIKFSVYNFDEGVFNFLPAVGGNLTEPVTDLYLAQVRILDPARRAPPEEVIEVTLGDEIQLLGYQLDQTTISPTEPVRIGLFWQATQPVGADYTVFTQLIGPDGQVWAQQDNQPQGGSFPTSAWPPFETVVDRYELHLSEGAPPGQYQLLVGQYDLTTGQRLAAVDATGQRLPNDAIVLATIMLE